MAQIIFTISVAQYQGKLANALIMEILWRIYLMERNAVFMTITKLTMLKQNQVYKMKNFKKIFTQLAICATLTISKVHLYLIVNGH